jgi:hypothetical protein
MRPAAIADHDCTTTALGALEDVDVFKVVKRRTSVIAVRTWKRS